MEEQLKLLRETMARSREQKAASGRSTVWRAGGQPGAKGAGSLSSYASDVLAKKNAALQRSKYGGVVQEAEARLKKLSDSTETKVSSSAQLSQQHPQYAAASSSRKPSTVAAAVGESAEGTPSVPAAGGPLPTAVRPISPAAGAAAPALSPSRRASEISPREYIHPQQDFSGRRTSEIVGPPPTGNNANFIAAPGTGCSTSRPPARMWRVPSALGTNLGPSPPPPKSPSAAPGVNPYLALPPGSARRSSDLHHLSSPRRASTVYNEDGLPCRRDPNAAEYRPAVPIPPPTASADLDLDVAADTAVASKTASAAAHTTSTPRLLDGTYDEASSHKAFQDALNEWRASKKTSNTKEKPPAQSRSSEKEASGIDHEEPLSALDNNARPTPPPLRARRGTDASSSGSSTGLLPTSSSAAAMAAARSRSGSLASFGQSFTNLAGSFVGEVIRRGASSMHLRGGRSDAGGNSEKPAGSMAVDTGSSTPNMFPVSATGARQAGPSSAPDVFASAPSGGASISTHSTNTGTSTDRLDAARAATEAAFGHVPGSGGPVGLTYMERLLLERLRAGEKQQQQQCPAVVGIEPAGSHSAPLSPPVLRADLDADEDDLEMGGPAWAAARGHQVLTVDTTPTPGAGEDEDRIADPQRPHQQQPFGSDDGITDVVPVSAGAWPSLSQTSLSSLGRPRAGTATSGPSSPVRERSVAAVVVEDVTGREDEAIMQAGVPVEVVGSDRGVVEEPDDFSYTLPFYKGR
ncbi:hypothetical protein HDU86_003373 [Geranomyces michiganensis]|nr:hypothetical protein HDU86_003373 [Geranomyces michiganensis]